MQKEEAEFNLAFIKQIMVDSRRSTIDNGKYYLLWGIVIGIASMANYLIVKNADELTKDINNFTGWIWANAILVGWVFSIVWGIRDGKKAKNKTMAGKIIGILWLGMGITGFILAMAGTISGSISPWSFCPLFAGLLGYGNFVSGTIHDSWMMKVMAFGWWAGAVWMFFIRSVDVLAVYSIFLFLFSIIPGIILYFKWKKELVKITGV